MKTELKVKVGKEILQLSLELPEGRVKPSEMVPVFHQFAQSLLNEQVKQLTETGPPIACKAGCGACCRQLVPVSDIEILFLRQWILRLPTEEQKVIRQRFKDALSLLDSAGMLDKLRKAFNTVQNKEIQYALGVEYLKLRVPCPFLIEESCSIHPYRPMACREYFVTSEPEYCSWPTREKVVGVPVKIRFSEILFQWNGNLIKRPLVLLFENPSLSEKKQSAMEIFHDFLKQVAELRGVE